MGTVRAPMEGVVACAAYAEGRRVRDVKIPDISEALKETGAFVWVGLHDPSPELLQQVQQDSGLHDLAVEDAQVAHQRPKARAVRRLQQCSADHAPGSQGAARQSLPSGSCAPCGSRA